MRSEFKNIQDDAESPSFLRRVGAILYDTVTVVALMFVGHALVVILLGTIGGWENFDAIGLGSNPLHIAYLLSIPPLFFLVFWTKGGQTLGMRAWRIRVVRTDGSPLSFRDALKRLLASLVSWACLALGFVWILFDKQNLAWHDRLSGTRLIFIQHKG